jgi:hypothetical protein
MLNKSAFSPSRPRRAEKRLSTGFILALLNGSTYDAKYDSPLRSLRPCWMAFLSILLECSPDVPYVDQSGVELFLDPLDLCL